MFAALTLVVSLGARAGEDNAYRQALSQSEFLAAALETSVKAMDRPQPLPSCPERLLSLNKTATVAIGGDIRTSYIYSRSDVFSPDPSPASRDPFVAGRGTGHSSRGDLALTRAVISLAMAAGDRWRAGLEVNLIGRNTTHQFARVANTGDPDNPYARFQDDEYIRAAFIELLKDGHSGLGFKIGKFALPFGLRGDYRGRYVDIIPRSYMDAPDLIESYLMAPANRNDAVRLPHASRLADPVLAALAGYEMRDILRFEAAIFQEREEERSRAIPASGGSVPEERTESPLPRSFQLGASFLPLEGWELSVMFRNRHSRSRGIRYWENSVFRTDFRSALASGARDPAWNGKQWSDAGTGADFGSTRNEQALIAGLAVEIPNTNLAAQLEYAHGWNQGFNRNIHSDGVNVGLSYRLTPRLTLFNQGEWLYVKDGSWMAADGAGGFIRDIRRNTLYRLALGLEYELSAGVSVEAGYQYEYWRFRSAHGDGGGLDAALGASMVYMGSKFLF